MDYKLTEQHRSYKSPFQGDLGGHNRKNFLILCCTLFVFTSCSNSKFDDDKTAQKNNVLLIAIDDLRPELNCYGESHIKSQNFDKLAKESVVFTRAYTQQAVCAPSRNTLMTGFRPDGLGIYDLNTFFRSKAPDVVTLSQHFKQNGYQAEGMGKIYHTGHGNKNDTLSWSTKHWSPNLIVKEREKLTSGDTTHLHTCYPQIDNKKLPWYNSTMPEENHDDALVATHAIDRMNALKDTNFFLAVGFVKPHLPFVAPRKYWEMYLPEEISIPSKDKPAGHPEYAFTNWGELRKYYNIPAEGYLTDEDARNMIHGYYACVSFIDAQIGRLVQGLKDNGLYENTLIVIWGDHGWKLGEYGDWCKHTNYELDTRIPLFVRVPGITDKGTKTDAIIETVDIYPTLCDLAGLTKPEHLQGTSFVPVLENPEVEWDDVAFSQYPRTMRVADKTFHLMGYSMRTDKYRYTRWVDRETKEEISLEVYDHAEPKLEMENLAEKEEYKTAIEALSKRFDEEYKKEHE